MFKLPHPPVLVVFVCVVLILARGLELGLLEGPLVGELIELIAVKNALLEEEITRFSGKVKTEL